MDTPTIKLVATIQIHEANPRNTQQALCNHTEKNTMVTDYDFPVWFWDPETTDEDRSNWMTQERCRRQAMRQQTAYRRRMERSIERRARREAASPVTVAVEEYR